MLDEDGVAREGSDLFWIELIANGKHELKPFVFGGRCNNRSIDVGQTVQHCSHRSIDERLSGQPLPWEIDIDAAGAIVERSGVVELLRPMRTFEIELPGSLGDPGQTRDCGGWVVPIDIEAGALCICPCDRDGRRKHFEETLYTFSVPGQSRRSSFVRPVIEIRRGAARVVAV